MSTNGQYTENYIKTQISSTHILHAEEVGNGVVSDHEMWVWSEFIWRLPFTLTRPQLKTFTELSSET